MLIERAHLSDEISLSEQLRHPTEYDESKMSQLFERMFLSIERSHTNFDQFIVIG
jgi:hypothetical protein